MTARELRAEATARKELLSYLTPGQRMSLKKHDYFEVVKPGQTMLRYRIHANGTLSEHHGTEPYGRYRGISAYDYQSHRYFPASDTALAVLLLIQHDHGIFDRTACAG